MNNLNTLTDKELGEIRIRLFDRSFPDDSGCRIWIGWRHRQGYGLLTIKKRRYLAHRVAYFLEHGSILDTEHICHHCDVTSCINIDHLYAGDAKTNRADCINRGRANMECLRKRGSERSDAKLTEAAVIEIRSSDESPRILAARYGVITRTIYKVIRRESWKHV